VTFLEEKRPWKLCVLHQRADYMQCSYFSTSSDNTDRTAARSVSRGNQSKQGAELQPYEPHGTVDDVSSGLHGD
jgi:hypothetical protein